MIHSVFNRRAAWAGFAIHRAAGPAALVLCSALSSCAGHAEETLDLREYQVTFEETFKTLDISAHGPGSRWIAHTPWNGDFGDAVFDDPSPTGPFSAGPAGLRITAHRDEAGHWHSGLICSMDRDGPGQQGFAQQFGYFEMRAKLPDGQGVWPAFWLIGIEKTSKASEIDVLEYYGGFPSYYHSVMHVFVDGHDQLLNDHLMKVASGQLTREFNDYGVSVERDVVRFYLNRKEVWVEPTPLEYNQPMYLLANLAIGGGWPSDKLASPFAMEIERISVFQQKSRLPGGSARP